MDDAEDCPIGSDTGRQREHGDEAESGGLSKQPEVLELTVFSFISRLPLPFTEQVLCVHFACFFVAGGGGDSGDGSG